jgi:hypothetical protein
MIAEVYLKSSFFMEINDMRNTNEQLELKTN